MASRFQQQFRDVTQSLKRSVTKVRNKQFMEAAVAGFVAVANANGVIKPEERDKMLGFIRSSEVLSAFEPAEIERGIDKYIRQYGFDAPAAEASVLGVIGRLKDKEAEARLLVRVCIVIGSADGEFDEDEKAVVRKICSVLGLNPADFDLQRGQVTRPEPPASEPAPLRPPEPAPVQPSGRMLGRGERLALRRQDPSLKLARVGLGWDVPGAEFDLDASAFMLGADGKARSDADFIFYNQPRSSCGAVEHLGERGGDRQVIQVDLERVPADIQRIAFTVTLHDAEVRRQRFGQVRGAYIRLVNAATEAEVLRYELANDATHETAMIFGELYRHGGEWRFTAVGQGYVGGLFAMCQRFGITAG